MSEPQLRIGLVGLGRAATGTLPSLRKHPSITVTAAADIRPEVIEQFRTDEGVQGFSSVEALCDSREVDAVYIATPTHLHTEHVIAAGERGKHVLVEKPMAITLEDARRMIDVTSKNNVQFQVGHSQSYEPPARKIREIVKSGMLGKLTMMHNWYYNDWLYRPRLPDELNTERGGGIVFRQGAHQFDIMRLIAGGFVNMVRAYTGRWDPARPTEGAQTAYMELDDGVVATAVYSAYDRFYTTEFTKINEGGQEAKPGQYAQARKAIRTAGAGGEEALKSQGRYGGARTQPATQQTRHQSFFGLSIVSCEKGDIRQSPDGLLIYGEDRMWEEPLTPGIVGRDLMVDEFYRAIRSGEPPNNDGRWAMGTLEVTLAVLQSSREHREVTLTHQVATRDEALSLKPSWM
ncbi:MAG TPA: Gfo/Idh/MocA family oxidoreductase [Chloroflexota bacterium]|nr:Gfo/Idh/MocA family oxidoreductase [Chloroflexota bacterium]